MLRTLITACTVGCALLAGAAVADTDPDNAIKYRKAVLQPLGANLTGIAMNAKGEVAFPDAVPAHAQMVAAAAPLLLPAFEQNTAGEGSAQTKAKDAIWDDWDSFAELANDLEVAAAELASVADAGDMAAVGRQLGAVGGTCKACHDKFRE